MSQDGLLSQSDGIKMSEQLSLCIVVSLFSRLPWLLSMLIWPINRGSIRLSQKFLCIRCVGGTVLSVFRASRPSRSTNTIRYNWKGCSHRDYRWHGRIRFSSAKDIVIITYWTYMMKLRLFYVINTIHVRRVIQSYIIIEINWRKRKIELALWRGLWFRSKV